MARDSEGLVVATTAPLKCKYLLVLIIPMFRDAEGGLWTDHLWHKDLIGRLPYIEDVTYACPFVDVQVPPPNTLRVDDQRIKFVQLPGKHKLTLNLPVTALRLWQAVGAAQVVDTGLGGWLPISICNMAAEMASLRRRFLFITVESSPWRLVPGRRASLAEKLKAGIAEWMNLRRLRKTDLAIFTQARYRASLMPDRTERGHVVHASWVNASVIVSRGEAAEAWSRKQPSAGRPPRYLFAGRLTEAKGVLVLLAAIRQLDARGRAVELHIIGSGDLLETCRQAKHGLTCAKIEVLNPVAYGDEFFQLVREYQAIVVPSLTDEQPRIVYDAYSQGVPALASDTDGLRDCIEDQVTGRLCHSNDPAALADLIEWAATNPDRLRAMGMDCLERAGRMTHEHMHRQRVRLISANLPAAR